jgi:hypothetical protein
MNQLCYEHLQWGRYISQDEENMLVDYLSENDIEVDIDDTTNEICLMVLKLRPYTPSLDKTSVDKSIIGQPSGKVPIDIYMNIAMDSDRETLLSMMSTSKYHQSKFDENFFQRYLNQNYPNII